MAVVYFSVRTGTLITLTVFMISIVHFHAVSLIIRLSFDITSRRRFYWEWMRWGKTLTTVRVRQVFKCQPQLTRNARYSIVFEVLFKDGRLRFGLDYKTSIDIDKVITTFLFNAKDILGWYGTNTTSLVKYFFYCKWFSAYLRHRLNFTTPLTKIGHLCPSFLSQKWDTSVQNKIRTLESKMKNRSRLSKIKNRNLVSKIKNQTLVAKSKIGH